jgi:diguanylate cyclase (GGDEF)-like protein/PAS domain S-box-containing protein
MDSVFTIIVYTLISLLYLTSAALALPIFRLPAYRRPVIGFVLTYLFLAGVFLSGIYRVATGFQTIFDYAPTLILAVVSGGISIPGILLLRDRLFSAQEQAKETQAAIMGVKAELSMYQQSLESLSQPTAIKDTKGNYLCFNSTYAEFLSQNAAEFKGKSDDFFLSTEEANHNRRAEEKVLTSGQVQVDENRVKRGDRFFAYRIIRSPLRNTRGEIVGILISVEDNSDVNDLRAEMTRWQKATNTLAEAEGTLARTPIIGLELTQFFERILNLFSDLAGTANIGLWQVTQQPLSALFVQGFGKIANLKGIRLRPGEDIIGKVLQNGQMIAIPDYQGRTGTILWPRDCRFQAALGLPIRNKDQAAYIISIFWEESGTILSPELIRSLEIFTNTISANIATSALYNNLNSEMVEWQKRTASYQYRLRLEHVIAVIASHFIGLNVEKVDEGILHSLQTICKIAGIDRCYLVLFARDGAPDLTQPIRYSNLTSKGRPGWEPILKEEDKWYPSKINQGEVVHIPQVGMTSEEEEGDASWLRERGIKSYTAVPLVANRSVIGYLGFESLREEVDWTVEVISLLKVSADMFVNLLEKKWAARGHLDNQEKLNRKIRDLEFNNQENILITQMGDLLQACRTSDEAYPIITRFIQRLIPDTSGALYMIQDAKDPAEKVAEWRTGSLLPLEHELIQNECWSLRRGRIYFVDDPSVEPVCGHIKEQITAGYMCVPLLAHGVAAGVLHLRNMKRMDTAISFTEAQQSLANRLAEYIAMPLTNLRLRDELRSQAIRDPLTKLFNRRYMEETLEREIRRAIRHQTSVGIIMFDIDKMKPINDRFGHDAGDLLLRTMGRELLGMFRGEDVACRYGGDEFTIVLPEAGLAEVWRRAEQMRDTIKRLNLVYDGKPLGSLSLSIGVAAFPDHGQSAEKVILAADAASYSSKVEGGDRIMMGRKTEN